MGVADQFRRKPAAAPEEELPRVDVLDFVLDGAFLRDITVSEMKVHYMPLTMAEEREAGDDLVERTVWMLAKAFKRLLEIGLESPESFLLEPKKSTLENARLFLNALPESTRDILVSGINVQCQSRVTQVTNLFDEYHEEALEEELHGIKRGKSPLDSFVIVEQMFKDTPYTYQDIASMTTLQYRTFMLARMEANVRVGNDHSDMRTKSRPRDLPKGSNSKRKTVGN